MDLNLMEAGKTVKRKMLCTGTCTAAITGITLETESDIVFLSYAECSTLYTLIHSAPVIKSLSRPVIVLDNLSFQACKLVLN